MDTGIKARPKFLTGLCIGSAVAGLAWIIMFVVLLFMSYRQNVPPGLFPGIILEYRNAGFMFVLAEILLALLGITAVILMWQMKKKGFYLYTITKVVTYFLPVIFIGTNHLTYPGLLLTSVFIVMYGVFFTHYS